MCDFKQSIEQIEFLDQCKDGLLDLVKNTYNLFPNKRKLLQSKDDDKKTCLHLVAYFGHDDVLEFLLEEIKKTELPVDVIDKMGYTPLLYACYRGWDQEEEEATISRITCVKLLVDAGANINYQKSQTYMTALHWAAYNNDKRVASYLMKCGASLSYSFNNETPLDVAGYLENEDVVFTIINQWWQGQFKSLPSIPNDYQREDASLVKEKLLKSYKAGQITPVNEDLEKLGQANSGNHVVLRYDTKQLGQQLEHSIVFRVMYWSSVIGLNDVVNYIIRLGYSPFIRSFKKQNALMGAVEAQQLETVKLILSFTFTPAHPREFEESKKKTDINGNNALHLAHKVSNVEIAKILSDQLSKETKDDRNHRGLAPIQMNHKKLFDDQEFDAEPDYCIVVKKARAAFLISQLIELNLVVKEFASALNKSETIIVIFFSDDVLDKMAEILEVKVRLLDKGQAVPFKNYAEEMFEQFQGRQKQYLMLKILEQEIDLDYYQKVGVIVEHFPLHDAFKDQINMSWKENRTKLFFGMVTGDYIPYMEPLNFIANYYGEKMAFYFAWLLFYTSWLMIPALPGIALFIYQMVKLREQSINKETMTLDNPYNCLYCIILAVWMTVFIEMWKRRESEIAHMWNMTEHQDLDAEWPDYRAELIIDNKTHSLKKRSFSNPAYRRVMGEFPSVLTGVAIIIACFFGYYTIKHAHEGESSYSVGSSVVNAIVIIILGAIYRVLAKVLANWENHQYQEDWENSLTSKIFAFQFVNAYISLFSIAFVDQDFNQLAQSLAIILAAKQVAMNLVDIVGPQLKINYKKKKLERIFRTDFHGKAKTLEDQKLQLFVENQCILQSESTILVMKYSEIIIQLGYVVLFAQSFPLAPVFCILSNFLEMKGAMNMMAFYQKRTLAQGASGIGAWLGMAEILSYASIGVNCGIIFWTSNTINQITDYKYTKVEQFMIVVLIEHCILAVKLLIAVLIKDVPDWVTQEKHEQKSQLEHIYDVLDDKAEEFKAKGNKLLADQINEMKVAQQMKRVQSNQTQSSSKTGLQEEEEEDEEFKNENALKVLKDGKKMKKRLKKEKKVTLQELQRMQDHLKEQKNLKQGAQIDKSKGNDAQKLKDVKKAMILQRLQGGDDVPLVSQDVKQLLIVGHQMTIDASISHQGNSSGITHAAGGANHFAQQDSHENLMKGLKIQDDEWQVKQNQDAVRQSMNSVNPSGTHNRESNLNRSIDGKGKK